MRGRSRGFTLTELLTALVIHSFFILMLGGTFYTLISFGSRSQMVMTARERGQRVINYIDSRVRNAGLGMWRLESSKEIREALEPLTINKAALYNSKKALTLPVAVTYHYQDGIASVHDDVIQTEMKKKSNAIYYGNVLTILYAQRETGTYRETGSDNDKEITLNVYQSGIELDDSYYTENFLNDTLIPKLDDVFWKKLFKDREFTGSNNNTTYLNDYETYKTNHSEDEKVIENAAKYVLAEKTNNIREKINYVIHNSEVIRCVSNDNYPIRYKYLNADSDKGQFYYSDFGKEKKSFERAESNDIKGWGVSRGTGIPFTVDRYDGDPYVNKSLVRLRPVDLYYPDYDYTIPNGDELLYLKCVRLFAEEPRTDDINAGVKERNFKVQKLEDEKWGTTKSRVNPYQTGILELYAELHTEASETPHILNVWVLSTGGRDRMTHERPNDWPAEARWTDDYKYQVLYVSKGTWKLNNLHKKDDTGEIDFTWN